ncbi:MAG: hypothetical protein U0L85_01995 [Bacilli bacterium]|nr:hypothetical protein [Bacilli bacterium]
MGMCNQECRTADRCGALIALLQSIAMQEAALANILNAEAEKLQRAVCLSNNINDLIAINESILNALNAATTLEENLRAKAALVLEEFENCCHR